MAALSEPEFEIISRSSVADLSYKQQIAYSVERKGMIEWMRTRGRDHKKREGLSEQSVRNYAYRQHQLMKEVWETTDRFVSKPTKSQADYLMMALCEDKILKQNDKPYSDSAKRKFQDTLKKYFEYRSDEYGAEQWDPPVEFSDGEPANAADYFTSEERQKLYNAGLTYNSPPKYNDLSPSERDRWKTQLSQELGIPKEEIRPTHFATRRRSWKIPSLIGATLDGALRPVEINRSNLNWIAWDKEVLKIPKAHAAKNRSNWEIAFRTRTIEALERWQEQRKCIDKYQNSNALWLNREGNRYNSANLNYLLDNLLEEAEISEENRKIVWYSFRKSTAQYIHEVADDQTTAAVLRSSLENVDNYTEPTVETVQNILHQIEDK